MLWVRLTLVLVVSGLFGVIALPDKSGPDPAALRRREARAVREVLADYREAIEAYRIDHGMWPGWEPDTAWGDDESHGRAACTEWFGHQLTQRTNAAGDTDLDAASFENEALGPYLPGGLPANPVNALTTVRVLGHDEPWPLVADDRTGWIYDARSGLLRLNSQGRTEPSDMRYFEQ
jgi:type II secretory pathway pseudopilin PulG